MGLPGGLPAHPRMIAKYFKMFPNKCLPDHPVTIWTDASLDIFNPLFGQQMFEFIEATDLALFIHPQRNNLPDEAGASEPMAKYFDQDIRSQIATTVIFDIRPSWASGQRQQKPKNS